MQVSFESFLIILTSLLEVNFFINSDTYTMKIQHTLFAAAMFASMSANAQTTFSVYGTADLALNKNVVRSDKAVKTEDNNIVAGGLSTNNFGLRGDTVIAPGLKALFNYEIAIDVSSKNPVLETRTGLVGLTGNYGTVTVGRRKTLVNVAQEANDAGDGANTAGWLGDLARDSRRDDMITLSTPVMSGFSADVQLGLGPQKRSTSATGTVTRSADAGNSSSVGLNYVNGPLSVKWVDETVKNFSAAVSAAGTSSLVAIPTQIASRKNSMFGATYDFGIAKLYFVDTKMSQGTQAALVSFDTQTLGVRAPIGNYTLVASVGTGKAKLTNSMIKADMNAAQLIAMYNLSKDSVVYVAYGTESISHPSYTKKADQQNTQLGMRYKF